MRITALKETKTGRVALSLDGAYTASLDMLTVGEYGLCVGDELSDERVAEILALSQSRRAKSRAIDLLSYRAHTSTELRRKLLRHATEEDADAAVSRMEELGLLDDADFARRYAEELFEIKLYGARRVRAEMQKKGLPRELIDAALENAPDERELIARLLATKLARYRDEPDKLLSRLLARGFDYDDIAAVIRAV